MLGWTYNCVYCWLQRAVFFATNKLLNIYIEFGFMHHHLPHEYTTVAKHGLLTIPS